VDPLQVVATEDDLIPPNEVEPQPRTDGIHLALADSIAEALGSLCFSEADEKVRALNFESLPCAVTAASRLLNLFLSFVVAEVLS